MILLDMADGKIGKTTARTAIQIAPEVHQSFKAWAKTKMPRASMEDTATLLIDWFLKQAPRVQTAITSNVDEGMEIAYAISLEKLAEELRAKAMLSDRGPAKPGDVRISHPGEQSVAGTPPVRPAQQHDKPARHDEKPARGDRSK
jgi:hypothetical protein